MKQKLWTFLIVNPASSHKTALVRLHKSILVIIALFVVIASVGFARLAYFGTAYAAAKFGVYQEKTENRTLLNKLVFLDRFVEHEQGAIAEMVDFEDAMRLQYGLNSINSDVRKAGVGGKFPRENLAMEALDDPTLQKADSIKRTVTALLRQAELQATTLQDMAILVQRQHDLWAQRPSIWPVRGSLTSTFGYRPDPMNGYMQFHEGLDIANTEWTPILATADGIVRLAGLYVDYGQSVILEHPLSGFKTIYAHMIRQAVTDGQFVRRGDVIGYVGSTGRSTGPHLHYEVRRVNALVNPLDYILPEDVVID